jgi:hypothetical protein
LQETLARVIAAYDIDCFVLKKKKKKEKSHPLAPLKGFRELGQLGKYLSA